MQDDIYIMDAEVRQTLRKNTAAFLFDDKKSSIPFRG